MAKGMTDAEWAQYTGQKKGGKRASGYTEKKDPVLGSVSDDAKKSMRDGEVGFAVKGKDKKKYLDKI